MVAAVINTHVARRASAGTGRHHGSNGRRLVSHVSTRRRRFRAYRAALRQGRLCTWRECGVRPDGLTRALPHDGCVGCATSDVVSKSVRRRETVLDARAPAVSVVSEARHIQRSERSGVLARTHCGGVRHLDASDLVAAVLAPMLPGGRPQAQGSTTAALAGDLSRLDVSARVPWRSPSGERGTDRPTIGATVAGVSLRVTTCGGSCAFGAKTKRGEAGAL